MEKETRLDASGGRRKVSAMLVSESVQCPFCGQLFELEIDTSISPQQFTTDCEICCRPFNVLVECEPGQILRIETMEE